MAKNIFPITGMREALKKAHNQGLSKAINKDFAAGAGADTTVYDAWVYQIEHTLYEVVRNYVKMKIEKRYNPAIKTKDIEKARKDIFPIWKTIALAGQDWDNPVRIHIEAADVEDLVGFSWKFVYREAGVAETGMGTNQFRRLVESKLGCMMAKAHWCTEEDANVLKEYDKAMATIENGDSRIEELKAEKEKWEHRIKEDTSADFRKFILEEMITPIKTEIKELEGKIAEAETTSLRLAKDVQNIEDKAFKQIP